MAPSERPASRSASAGFIPFSFTRNSATTGVASRSRRTGSTRERMVGSSAPGLDEVRMRVVSAGGSSSSLRKALAASGLLSCGTISSASPTTNTLRPPVAGRTEARRWRFCTIPMKYAGALSYAGTWKGSARRSASSAKRASSSFSRSFSGVAASGRGRGKNQWTSGCSSRSTKRHDWQLPQASPSAPRREAEDELRQPEPHPLLPHPRGAVQEERLRQVPRRGARRGASAARRRGRRPG